MQDIGHINQEASVAEHGTAVMLHDETYGGAGLLLRGASGSGKSDLAFRLISMGAALIGDDRVTIELRHDHDRVYVAGVEALRGMIEVRGVGLLKMQVAGAARLRLVVDLVAREAVPRLPDWDEVEFFGVRVPRLSLHGFDASAPQKVMAAMRVVHSHALIVQ